jgi:hypothetical protein
MYFGTKSYLKNTHNHTAKHARAMTITRKLDDIVFLSETSLSACPAIHLHGFFSFKVIVIIIFYMGRDQTWTTLFCCPPMAAFAPFLIHSSQRTA